MASACQNEYTLPASACDDFCRAVERADCAEDYPADCVRDCEHDLTPASCGPNLRALGDCYAATDASTFACINDRSQPPDVCLPERRELSECLAPGSGPCFDECSSQVDTCGATLSDCEAACHEVADGCELTSHEYYSCLQANATECRAWLEPDSRPAGEIPPCYYPALAILACLK